MPLHRQARSVLERLEAIGFPDSSASDPATARALAVAAAVSVGS